MTHREKVIVSAYTGILMCDFSDVHEYIEKILGGPVWTHQLADKKIWDEIKKASKSDFIAICEAEDVKTAPDPVPDYSRLAKELRMEADALPHKFSQDDELFQIMYDAADAIEKLTGVRDGKS